MKVLITGAAGFIGSNLVRTLLNKKDVDEIIALDNFYSGLKENLQDLPVTIVEHDIRKPFDIKADIIYNLASLASPKFYWEMPIETLETSAIGIKNVLENAKKYNSIVIHTSTSEVYGDPLVNPQPETYYGNVNPVGPRSCYDEGKRYVESYLINFSKKYNLEVRIPRIFNTYGPYMRPDDGRVVSNFITQALEGKNLTVYNDGNQTRSFCYVDDTVEALIKLIDAPNRCIYNIGNPNEFKIIELAKYIKELLNPNIEFDFITDPLFKDDPKVRRPDISKIKKELGWEPKTTFDEGIKKTINWFKKVRGEY